MTDDNRHRRDPRVISGGHDSLGWVVDIIDQPTVDGVHPGMDVDLQLKPHPDGYQVTLWWYDEEGEKKQRDDVVRFSDPRDEVKAR